MRKAGDWCLLNSYTLLRLHDVMFCIEINMTLTVHFKHLKYIDNFFPLIYLVVWGVASWSDFSFSTVHSPGTSEISSNGRWLLILRINYQEQREKAKDNPRVTHVVNGITFGLLSCFSV